MRSELQVETEGRAFEVVSSATDRERERTKHLLLERRLLRSGEDVVDEKQVNDGVVEDENLIERARQWSSCSSLRCWEHRLTSAARASSQTTS